MATIRPGVYVQAIPAPLPVSCEVERLNHELECMDEVVLIESIKQVSRQLNRLSDAKIIIAGGRGVGGKQGFSLLGELADLFGGAVGASRGAVNAGYADYGMQVGQTGRIVHPSVYIGFGISGAIQHVVGMQSSRKIIAVNSDPRARIFSFADIGIVGDWESVARMMIQSLKEERNQEASHEFKKTL
jgi:electron transfer flavoprotein alpha subunit